MAAAHAVISSEDALATLVRNHLRQRRAFHGWTPEQTQNYLIGWIDI